MDALKQDPVAAAALGVSILSARMPTISESRLLDMDVGTPLLVIRKLAKSVTGEVVDHTSVLLPGDRAQAAYDIPLKPWPENWAEGVEVVEVDE